MRHPFMEQIAAALAERRIGTLRYEFPYMEKGGRSPDRPAVAVARVREAVAEAARVAPGVRCSPGASRSGAG